MRAPERVTESDGQRLGELKKVNRLLVSGRIREVKD